MSLCCERRKTGYNFMEAIKSAFVTVKCTGLPNILMVFNGNKRFKGFGKPVEGRKHFL